LTGAAPTIGLVEGILLLAENLPRDTPVGMDDASEGSQMQVPTHRSREKGQLLNGVENRQAWMLIGGAIRMAYGLGIDQVCCVCNPSHRLTDHLLTGRVDGSSHIRSRTLPRSTYRELPSLGHVSNAASDSFFPLADTARDAW
jgi:hypothetical protein